MTAGALANGLARHPTAVPDRPAQGRNRRVAVRWQSHARGLWVAAAAALALSGSLPRLWDATEAQDPTAYRLTAVIVGGLALLARARRAPGEPGIHDRQVDYLIGLPLLVLAAAELAVPPARFHERFWTAHADLLALPLLAAGAITVVFGTRALWRQRVTLVAWLLVLAPLPADTARQLSDWLAWPVLALARAAGGQVGRLTASPPGDTIIHVAGGSGGDIAFGGALRGLAGALAAAVLVILFAATATSRRGALGRALVTAAVCSVAIGGRIGIAVVVGAVGGPADAEVVLGRGGDLVTLGLILLTTGGLGLAVCRRRTHPTARRPGASRAGGRPPVPRAQVALALVALACAGLAALDVAGNRDTGPASQPDAVQHGTVQHGTVTIR